MRVLLVIALLIGAAAGQAASVPSHHVRVDANAAGRDWLSAHGFDIAGHDLAGDRVWVVTDPVGLAALREAGFSFEVLETFPEPIPLAEALGEPGIDDPLPDQSYTDPGEMQTFLQQVAADHPTITRLEQIGTTIEGRPIWAMLISDNAAVDEDELSILFSGAHHAREVMTPEIIKDTIDRLTDQYGIDPGITQRVDAYQIWCVPIVNPDGVQIVFSSDFDWRKNARDNDNNSIIDIFDGVDLNRNYEWGWGGQCQGSSSSFFSGTYRGPSEGSEAEIQAMVALGRRFRPVFDVEYHSFGEDVFYAMSCDPDDFNPRLTTVVGPDQDISRVIAEGYAAVIEQADGEVGFSAAPFGSRVDGVGRDHQYHENGAIAFVTEVNSSAEGGFRPSFATYRDVTVEGQRPGWLWLIDRIEGPAVGGHVLDAVSGLPVAADVSLDELQLPDGKRLTSREDTGRFHVIVVPGSYTLRVSAPGYQDFSTSLTVGASFSPVAVNLQPTGSMRLVFDDLEDPSTPLSWTAGDPSDDATDGLWEWSDPQGSQSGSVQGSNLVRANARFDRSAEGTMAFVTGNASAVPSEDDVDGGVTSVTSPAFDLSASYGVTVSWQRWFVNDLADPVDTMEAEVSVDGGSAWTALETLNLPTSTVDAAPAWSRATIRLDDLVAPGPDVRFRFRVSDTGADHIVEGAIDDLEIRGFDRATQGRVGGVVVDGKSSTVISWQPVTGAANAVYDVARGELAQLSGGGSGVDLGPLTCVEENSSDTSTSGNPDGATPASGEGFYYVVRFNLGFSTGEWGRGSEDGIRTGSGGCSP